MENPGRDDDREQCRQESLERLFIAAREDERRRRRRSAAVWMVVGTLLLGYWLADVAVGWPGLLGPCHTSRRRMRASLALAAFGFLIVFSDRAADWLRERFNWRHDNAFGLALATGVVGFAATWWLGAASGVIAGHGFPPCVLLGLYIVRRFLAWLDRACE